MITNVLVANRGEIARRVFRTCAALGIARTAVFSDADAAAPHVADADAAVRLPGDAPADTYLRGDLLVAAARAAGADAVHPGYGFLSENAAFARAVLDAGLTWIGPPPEAIAAMGSKTEAKRITARAGVPALPALDPASVGPGDLPVLVKASAGGGGRGMRVVRTLDALPEAVAAARAEAAAAFGDPAVFCEPYLPAGRHIEVQVLADRHGTVWTLGERECSLQRRHQKLIEETPSPFASPALRARLAGAARAAATAIDYVGAGTVEFLVDPDGRFFFLEMNTRLQVEHPVTECVTGLDLVACQIRVAEGHRLPPEPPAPRGHAVEARLYAEDPADDWRPQPGTLHRFAIRAAAEFTPPPETAGGAVRVDSGVADGTEIGVWYDPLLAKVIAWAPDRALAARRLAGALAGAVIHGPRTNRDTLVNILRHPAFLAGDTDTAFIDRHGLTALSAPLADPAALPLAAAAAALADAAANRARARVLGRLPPGWRNLPSAPQRKHYRHDSPRREADGAGGTGEYEVCYHFDGAGGISVNGDPLARAVTATPDRVVLDTGGVRRAFAVARYGERVFVDGPLGPAALTAVARFAPPAAQTPAGSLVARMPGTVRRVAVAVGDTVSAGQTLVWLEAMKMQHTVTAPTDGHVTRLGAAVGQQVEPGTVLAVITQADQHPTEQP